MKRFLLILLLFVSTLTLFPQYSIKGIVVTEYSGDSLIALPGIEISMIGDNRVVRTNNNGYFEFDHVEKGNYSLVIFNKLMIKNILLRDSIQFVPIKLFFDSGFPQYVTLVQAIHPSSLKNLYHDFGSFEMDTVTNCFYDHGLFVENQKISEPADSVWRLYREGEWRWGNTVVNYSKGKLNGRVCSFYSENKLNYEGSFKENKRDGKWIYYNISGTVDFKVEFQEGCLIIDHTDFDIKKYNENAKRIATYQ